MFSSKCLICQQQTTTYCCHGCSKRFCFDHLTEHREKLEKQFYELEYRTNLFLQKLNNQENFSTIRTKFNMFSEMTLVKLQKELEQFQQQLSILVQPNAQTIAGGNGEGYKLNQFAYPYGICVDQQQQHIYIADHYNHCILQWQFGQQKGRVVAGGNGQGNRIDQLNHPTDVIIDENSKSLIISDQGNRRVVRWSLQNPNDKQILIENIECFGLKMNGNRDLFVSDLENHAVKRWTKDHLGKREQQGTIVSGGNGRGDRLNQFNCLGFIFIDREDTVYVSDCKNHRVMKWLKGASERIVVAGGYGRGYSLKELSSPQGLLVNQFGDVYVTDRKNHRIMYWSLGSNEGRLIAGGTGRGKQSNQLNFPRALAFDDENNLYVSDCNNQRIQRFLVDKH